MDTDAILAGLQDISEAFAKERVARQRRSELAASDFERLRRAGFLLSGVPVQYGGVWDSVERSTRPVCEMLRTLARGDSSVALVCSMHPAVLSFWLTTPDVPPPHREAWEEQRREVFQTALDGAWWGTITSEPGSGGDVARTKATAQAGVRALEYRLTGTKHFGSGSGISSYMITTAVPAGESEPDWFYLDMRGARLDGSGGAKIVAEWDGHGMIATQSHAVMFEEFAATRFAWPGHLNETSQASGGVVGCLFTAVIVGITEAAIETARLQLAPRHGTLRPYEQVEWSQVEMEGWLIQQAYEGMLRAIEAGGGFPRDVLLGKTAIAELAESALRRICRIIGGGTFNRLSPFGFWFEDVRALGFLRPPWGLAYDRILEMVWPPES